MQVLDHFLKICVASLTLAAFVVCGMPAAFSEQPEKLEGAAPSASQAPPPVQNPAESGGLSKNAVAKDLFGAVKEPANMATRSIGFYATGLAGGKPLPANGPAWQVMRLSRNRNWGHPSLIRYIERFAMDAKEKDRWPGLLVGDLSLPRGGPMPFGHKSHQVGLEADIWYKPAPNYELSPEERETMKLESFLLDPGHVNPAVWTPDYEKFLRRAVSYPEVALIFVHPAIKKWLCENLSGDRPPLSKIIPLMGHDDHFHARLFCPAGNPGCRNQKPKTRGDGCGAGLDKWIEALMKVRPGAPDKPPPKKTGPVLTLGQLPPECEAVLKADPLPRASAAAAP
jgi:penicillin-insensitive murein DD-endopeptidase